MKIGPQVFNEAITVGILLRLIDEEKYVRVSAIYSIPCLDLLRVTYINAVLVGTAFYYSVIDI